MRIKSRQNAPKWLGALLLLAVLLMLGGCDPEPPKPVEPPGGDTPTAASQTVQLYFANNDYINSGDETKPHFLIIEGELGADPPEPLTELLELLRQPVGDTVSTALEPAIKILSVQPAGADPTVIEVNLAKSGLNGSSLNEQLLMGQIAGTLLANQQLYPAGQTAQAVRFLVEGKTVESLMGHLDASVPIGLDDPILQNKAQAGQK